jgi:quercetin dioxygenase-like cupin family protein
MSFAHALQIGVPSAPAAPAPLVRAAEDAPALELLGARLRFLVSAAETGGAWSLTEHALPAGFAGPAAHYHVRATETFVVLEGTLALELDGTVRALGAGGVAVVPAGSVHRFGNPGPRPCRFLVQATPPGVEEYLHELAKLVRASPRWPLPDMRPVLAMAQRFDVFSPAEAPR